MLRTIFLAMTLLISGVAPVLAQDAAAGEKDFLVCRACHQIGPTAKNAVGPVLNGVVGRKAGTYAGFTIQMPTRIPVLSGRRRNSTNI